MIKDIYISICVPAFNEEKTLRGAVEDLLEILHSKIRGLDIIIVDDGSTDSTPQVAVQLTRMHKNIRVIRHAKRMGIGASYRDALRIAWGDYFTWFPADHENSAREFILCLPYLKKGAIATCYHRGLDHRPYLRRFISRGYTALLNIIFRLNLKYYNGLTIFPLSALSSSASLCDGFFFTAENIIKAVRRGYKVIELPAPLRGRTSGSSSALTFSSFRQAISDILRILRG
jgi:glycosyltransferase involved in cell wall biosynthesis